MAQHEIETKWMGKMQFNALVNGHTIIMDGPEKVGGEDNGPISLASHKKLNSFLSL